MALFNSTDLDLLNNEERDDRTYQLATCYLKTNDLREAAIWFETLRANSPKYATDCDYYISYIRYTQKRYNEALKGFLPLQDNAKYKAEFNTKAKMIPYDDVENYAGHKPGGVCPFGVKENVKVYLDESLKRFDIIYPACGSSNSAVKLTIAELEKTSNYEKWVDVCKDV